jgi:transcriptional regulator GlxA family with amidase domain
MASIIERLGKSLVGPSPPPWCHPFFGLLSGDRATVYWRYQKEKYPYRPRSFGT